jgi:5-methylcytosine-specific restriction endonuclease McrA
MMMQFLEVQPSVENYWRALILFGRNVASYKFALGKALLELRAAPGDLVKLDDLALPFARNICEHLRNAPKQATSQSSRFLEACRNRNSGEISEEELRNITVALGFNNVIDAFHRLGPGEIPKRFFIDERSASKGIRLTDELRTLGEIIHPNNLMYETEGRWRLVETAWRLGVNSSLIEFDPESEAFYVKRRDGRIDVTSARSALNGYQKGHCFYCFAPISTEGGIDAADVDHFFPLSVRAHLAPSININGIWNLVLACRLCNRGKGGKSNLVPPLPLLHRLHKRNEFLITSHHPLRETLMLQTGVFEQERAAFLQKNYEAAVTGRIALWRPAERAIAVF